MSTTDKPGFLATLTAELLITHIDTRGEWTGCEAPDGKIWFVATLDGRAVGMLSINTDDRAQWAWVGDLYVTPAHRRRGIATRLMYAASTEARELGVLGMACAISRNNEASRALFEGHGFTHVWTWPGKVEENCLYSRPWLNCEWSTRRVK